MEFANEKRIIIFFRGVILLLLGLLVLTRPAATLSVIVTLVAIYVLVAGIVDVVKGIIAVVKEWPGGSMAIIIGLLGIFLGILILKYPAVALIFYVIFLGLLFIIKGIFEIFFPPTRTGGSKWLSILVGILTLVLGVLLFDQPLVNGAALFWVIGVYALVAGILTIVSAFVIKAKE